MVPKRPQKPKFQDFRGQLFDASAVRSHFSQTQLEAKGHRESHGGHLGGIGDAEGCLRVLRLDHQSQSPQRLEFRRSFETAAAQGRINTLARWLVLLRLRPAGIASLST